MITAITNTPETTPETKIIAELGTIHYHEGIDFMKEAVGDCFSSGADLVKMQLINYRTAWWASEESKLRYYSHESHGWGYKGLASGKIENFFEEMNARHNGRVFASVFDECFLGNDMLSIMPMWKLGYKVSCMSGLINKLMKVKEDRKIPVLASLSHDDLDSDCFMNYVMSGFKVLQVTPHYPTLDYQQLLTVPCSEGFDGHSIHTNNMDILKACLVLRSRYLEVHVKVDGNGKGPDTEFAITLQQLKELSNFRGLINGV